MSAEFEMHLDPFLAKDTAHEFRPAMKEDGFVGGKFRMVNTEDAKNCASWCAYITCYPCIWSCGKCTDYSV